MSTSVQSTDDDVHVGGALRRSGLFCPHFTDWDTEKGTEEAAGLTEIGLAASARTNWRVDFFHPSARSPCGRQRAILQRESDPGLFTYLAGFPFPLRIQFPLHLAPKAQQGPFLTLSLHSPTSSLPLP